MALISAPALSSSPLIRDQMERDLVGNEFGTKVSALASEVGRAVFKRYFVKQNLQQGISRLVRFRVETRGRVVCARLVPFSSHSTTLTAEGSLRRV